MFIGSKFTPSLTDRTHDVIVIGSGMSGLTLAGLLARQGRSVMVLEKHYTAGGLTHTYWRKGSEWDSGLHYIGDVHKKDHMLRILLDYLTGGGLQWASLPQEYDRIVLAGQSYSFLSGEERFREEILKHFPREKAAVEGYLKLISKTTTALGRMAYGKLLPQGLSRFSSLFDGSSSFRASTYDVLRGLTGDEKLIAVLTGQWGNYGLPPRQSSFGTHGVIAHHYLDGASFPLGGSSEVARTLVKGIEEHGGKVIVSTGVRKIILEGNTVTGVLLENGASLKARTVVSSAGVHQTFLNLFDQEALPSSLRDDLRRASLSQSYLSLSVKLKGGAALNGHAGGNIWVYQDHDHDRAFHRYLASPLDSAPPFQYISFPSLKDPTWKERTDGKHALSIMGLASHEWFKEWEGTRQGKRPTGYLQKKEELTRPYLDTLEGLFPGIQDDIEYCEVSSPLTMRHYTNNFRGEIYGIDLRPERFRETWLRPRTPFKNFFMTGQDMLVNGVCSAMMSGALTSMAMHPVDTFKQLRPIGVIQ